MTEKFSPQELSKQNAPKEKKKSVKKSNKKYITKVVDGVKHMVINPNYTFKHND